MWAAPGSGEHHRNTAQFNLDSGVPLRQAEPTPISASMRFAGSRRFWTSYRVNRWTRAGGEVLQDPYCFLVSPKRSRRSTGCRRSASSNGSTHGTHGCRPVAAVRRGTKPPSIVLMPRRARCCGRGRPRCWSGSPLHRKRTQSARIKAPSKRIGDGVATLSPGLIAGVRS
jgi:hypothetical protein